MNRFASLLDSAVAWSAEHALFLAVVIGAALIPMILLFLLEKLYPPRELVAPRAEPEPQGEVVEDSQATAEAPPLVEEAPVSVAPEPAVVEEPPPPAAEPVVAPEPAQPPEFAPSEPEPPPPVEAPKPRARLRDRLARTSENLAGRLGGILSGRKVDADLLDELEALLFTADLGVTTAESLLDTVRSKASGSDASLVREVLREAIYEKLQRVQPRAGVELATGGPHVILVLGVNGSGKTTTIGKLAARYAAEGKSVLLGAGDTFRAAATEQLQVWGERVGCEVIAGKSGGDPAAVAFDTVKAASARGIDVCIVDTAGRLQTKKPLMEELGKIHRVLGRDLPGAPHECLLVLDSNTGQNAISQARLFTEVAEITGLVLTKLDGTAKGGVIIGLADEFEIPVEYVGVGEGVEDLRDFDAREFVDALFPEESD